MRYITEFIKHPEVISAFTSAFKEVILQNITIGISKIENPIERKVVHQFIQDFIDTHKIFHMSYEQSTAYMTEVHHVYYRSLFPHLKFCEVNDIIEYAHYVYGISLTVHQINNWATKKRGYVRKEKLGSRNFIVESVISHFEMWERGWKNGKPYQIFKIKHDGFGAREVYEEHKNLLETVL